MAQNVPNVESRIPTPYLIVFSGTRESGRWTSRADGEDDRPGNRGAGRGQRDVAGRRGRTSGR